jgi:hypothetical protein
VRVAIASLVAAAVVAIAANRADAYPQFQLSTGNDRCQACHFGPAGGGLLNDFGRSEAGDTISRGGDGGFLHGAWTPPGWLALGLDLRAAGAVKQRDEQRELLAFPMQADVYARIGGDRFSLNLTVGLRGGARDPQPPLIERLASREHYVMYQRESGLYVRAGRFFPVFGVRTADHTAYVRRNLGFGILEEPYALGAGTFHGAWEAHVTGFVPNPIPFLGAGVRARGAAAYVERRLLDDHAAIAGQVRVAVSSDDARYTIGAVGKRWFPDARLLLLAELDLQVQTLAHDAGPRRLQLASYLSATQTITRGVQVGVGLHRWHPDLSLRSARDAFEVNVQYFPRAHLELHLLTRLDAQGGDLDASGLLALLQLHYYL